MAYPFNTTPGGDAALLEQLGFDPRNAFTYPTTTAPSSHQIPVTSSTAMAQQSSRQSPPVSWPMSFDLSGGVDTMAAASSHSPTTSSMSPSSPEDSQGQSPGHHSASASSSPLQQQLSPYQTAAFPTAAVLPDWTLQQQQQQLQQQQQAAAAQELQYLQTSSAMIPFNHFAASFPPSPLSYLPATTAALDASIPIGTSFNPIPSVGDMSQATQLGMGIANWQDFETLNYQPDGLARIGNMGSHSPTGTYLEVLSLGSASDNGWATVDVYHGGYDAYQNPATQNTAIFNPSQTLHLRSNSDSSQSDGLSNGLGGSFEEVSFPYSPFSPESDTQIDPTTDHRNCLTGDGHHHHAHEIISPAAAVAPMAIKAVSISRAGPSSGSGIGASASSASPPARRGSGPRKSPIAKPKAVIRRSSSGKDKATGEKKVGRRRGPLLPEQRKQASEIRKLRACLRCKFLKKTCDKGEPCAGCQPSHARLWQVPCTRIDIKDLGYFMKDWKADYDRHMGRGVSVYNVKGFAPKETLMWITHGYGFCLPIMVREVFVADDSCFQVDWVESHLPDQDPIDFGIRTERLDVGQDGVNVDALHEYLDKHLDQGFDYFVEDHFDGTPFLTEILKTAHRFYIKEKTPIIRKALKLVLAYNLTLHITMIEQQGNEVNLDGQIDDEDSKYFGKVVAPVMINFQIKCAMADMWRELQKDILEELSALYSSVYSGERLKNWPTIFLLASILLAVWEEIQFDCHYRVLDTSAVNKFCNDMESTPVGVIVGLFHAISQKLPSMTEWDTRRHGQLLNNNEAVCEAMTEVRSHVLKHESYLRTRSEAKFDRYDFDSLSNKFLSKLVIRSN